MVQRVGWDKTNFFYLPALQPGPRPLSALSGGGVYPSAKKAEEIKNFTRFSGFSFCATQAVATLNPPPAS